MLTRCPGARSLRAQEAQVLFCCRFFLFGPCIPLQEEHLVRNWIPCLGEFCSSEAVLGPGPHWQRRGRLLFPRQSAVSPLPRSRPCRARPSSVQCPPYLVVLVASVTDSFLHIVCGQKWLSVYSSAFFICKRYVWIWLS